MDSRSLDFADEILTLTDGRGVDVVLNSWQDRPWTRVFLLSPTMATSSNSVSATSMPTGP
ncbi:MAG: hypothetical protein R3C68_08890 [Myxococcota bacterium]